MFELLKSRPCILIVIVANIAFCAPFVATADTIRIGAILSLTGNSAELGQSIRDGILLAVDEVNKRGGVNGSRIDIDIEDSKSDPKAAVEAFNKMESTRPPIFYVSYLSSVGVALAPLADEKKVVLVGLVTAALAFTQGREMVYRYWPLARLDMPPLLRILKDLKVKKLGIIYSNEEYGIEEQKLLSKAFEDVGGTAHVQSFEMGATDFRQQIMVLNGQEAVLVASVGTNLVNVIHQLRETGYRGHILMPSSGPNPAFFLLPDFQGVYLVAPIIHNPSYLYAREAGEKFTARFQRPFSMWAANGYDFIKLICGLFEDRSVSRQSVRDIMAGGFEYSGVFGHVRLRPGEHDLSFPVYPTQIVNGTLIYR